MEPDLFEQIVRISRKAFAEERYDVSYHLLSAALHCAQDEKSVERLHLVERLARESLEWIDEFAPDHEHSSRSSKRRKTYNIFDSLTKQAGTAATAIRDDVRLAAIKAQLAAPPEHTDP
jgi:hypothetical protein